MSSTHGLPDHQPIPTESPAIPTESPEPAARFLRAWLDGAPKYARRIVLGLGAILVVYMAVVIITASAKHNGGEVMAQFGDAMAFPATLLGGIALFVSALALLVQRADMKEQLNEYRRSSEAQTTMAERQLALIDAQLQSAAALRELADVNERETAQVRLSVLLSRIRDVNSELGGFTNQVREYKGQLLKQGAPDELAQRALNLLERADHAYHKVRFPEYQHIDQSAHDLWAVLANETPSERDHRFQLCRQWLDQLAERREELSKFQGEFAALKSASVGAGQ